MKKPTKSKTIWTGGVVTLLSIVAILVEVWGAFSPEQMQLIKEFFGPETTAAIGLVMVALRIVTRSPLKV